MSEIVTEVGKLFLSITLAAIVTAGCMAVYIMIYEAFFEEA